MGGAQSRARRGPAVVVLAVAAVLAAQSAALLTFALHLRVWMNHRTT